MVKNTYMKYLFMLLTFASGIAHAQSQEASVQAIVDRLFEGMKKSDTALIRSAFAPGCILQTVVVNKENKTVLLTEALDSFLLTISRPHNEIYDERIRFDQVKIDGELAMVWAPYEFYLGNQFSHCGVDSFQLIHINGEWKIQYLVDTRRRQGCK